MKFTVSRIVFSFLSIFGLVFPQTACVSYHAQVNPQQSKGAMTTTKNENNAPVLYVALGDSTGVGVGARDGGYVARLFKRIEREHPNSHLKNFCVSGAATADLLREQIGPAIVSHPTLITIGIGINDIGHGVSAETFAANYEEIVKRLKDKTNAPIIVANLPDVSLAPVVPSYMRETVHERVMIFNEKIKEIAKRNGLLVVDAFAATHDSIEAHPEFFSSDGFHPSDIGYEYWAKTMWPTVKRAIEE